MRPRPSFGGGRSAISTLALWWLATAALVSAHDMYLVVPSHHLPPHSEVTVWLYNGTFDESLNVIDRDRMIDVSIVDGAGEIAHPSASQWREEDNTTLLTFDTTLSGTYVVGVSTAPNIIELSAEEFNDYLAHDGVVDVLGQRERGGQLDKPARERYSKHVKTLLQVGDLATDRHTQWLGYPVEIVPQQNPAALQVGDSLEVLVLDDGVPVAEQIVYASYAGFHENGGDGEHREAASTRTDAGGLARIEITHAGRWYIRLIRMLEVLEGDVDYESRWATLTFEIE